MSPPPAFSAFSQILGLRVIKAEKDRVLGELDATNEHTTATDRVHGGFLMAFGDSLGAIGAVLNMPKEHSTSTIESKTNFLRAAKLGRLQGAAVPLHVGRTTQVWRTDISDATGRTVATVTQTQLVMPDKPKTGESTDWSESVERPVAKPLRGESIPAQRRRQIFEAASRVFGRKGFASASVREIAEAAGMPVPTMYQYFRSKEDILALVFDTYMLEMGGSVQSATATQCGVVEKLTNAISASLAMHDKYRHQIRLMYQETRSLGPQNRTRALNIARSANQIWRNLIREGNASGDFNVDSPNVTANFIPMLSASWVLRRWNMDEAQLSDVNDALVNFVRYGLTGPRRSEDRADVSVPASKRKRKRT